MIGWVDGACHRYNPLTNWSLPTHGPHRRHSHHEQPTTISGNGGGDNRFILMMIVAPDQTMILGVQIFLNHRSLSSIYQQILITLLVLIMRYVEFLEDLEQLVFVRLAVQHSCCLCCCCTNLAIARLPLDCTVGLQIKKLFILPSLSSSSCCSQRVQFSGHSRTL